MNNETNNSDTHTATSTGSLTAIQVVQKEIEELTRKITNDELKRKASAEISSGDKRILKQKEHQLQVLTRLNADNG